MTEMYLISLIEDQEDRLINRWVERLHEHPESKFDRDAVPELDAVCREGLAACLALLDGKKDPLLKDFVQDLLTKRVRWDLETPDLLRFFWELRKAVTEVADTGGDPGAPDWKTLHAHLDPCVEAGIIHLVKELEER